MEEEGEEEEGDSTDIRDMTTHHKDLGTKSFLCYCSVHVVRFSGRLFMLVAYFGVANKALSLSL